MLKQKIIGVVTAALTTMICAIGGDITAGMIGYPLSVLLIVSKEYLFID